MTCPDLPAIRARINSAISTVAWPETPEERDDAEAEVTSIVAQLLGMVERVEGLAAAWEARGEHDMAYSKTIPDEDIAMALLTEGATMVENARHIRNAITGEGQL